MEDYVRHDELTIKCNIKINQIHDLFIQESINSHTFALIKVSADSGSQEVSSLQLDSQPIMIYSTKNKKEFLLFSGVIGKVEIVKEACYDILSISAYSLSWFMDLERKSRSFQDCNESMLGIIHKIVQEHDFSAICTVEDLAIKKPFIQYEETDWQFLLRLSTHLHVPFFGANDYSGRGIYLGFQENGKPLELNVISETWSMEATHVKFDNWRTKEAAYFDVVTSQVFHLGECVTFKNEVLWPYRVKMYLLHGVLQCAYYLAGKHHYRNSVSYNPCIKCSSLAGTVLDRKDESIKIHLDIDEEQDSARAFFYPWFPEHGNLVYCMPEVGSKIRLLIPGEDEQDAMGIHCVRQNGPDCEEIQKPDERLFSTTEKKKIKLQTSSIELASDGDQSKISLQDNIGNVISSSKEVLIQAKGKVSLQGAKIELRAPKEIITVKRQLGSPTVVNICHNLDALGGQSTFENLAEVNIQNIAGGARNNCGGQYSNKHQIKKDREEKEKLQFKLKDLLEEAEERNNYDLGSSIMKIISSIPQNIEQDRLSQIALGFRPIMGRMKGE